MKKIALISAINDRDPYQASAINLGLLYLEAYLAKYSKARAIPVNDIDSAIRVKPDLVGISSVTENYGRAIKMARKLKAKLKVPVIIGGVHISTLPESLDPVFDAGIIGEGEETLLEFVRSYPSIEKVKGIVLKKNGRIFATPLRPQIHDLDRLPAPNRKKWVKKIGIPYVMTTRGCLFKCGFCSSPAHWRSCRRFSPQRVIADILDLKKNFDVRFIRFFDDILTIDKKRLGEIVALIRAHDIEKHITFGCFSRVGMINKDIVALLQKGNIRFVGMGLESASEKVLGSLKDRPFSVKAAQEAIDLLYDSGINVNPSFIIGAPGETEADLKRTLKFIEKNAAKIQEIEINPLIPNPGTLVWHYALKRGLVSLKMDWSRIKDPSYLLTFDADKYIYLNTKMPYKAFLRYVDIFKELYRSISLSPKNVNAMQGLIPKGSIPFKYR